MILYPGSSTVVERDFAASENAVTVVAKDYNGLSIPITAAVKIDAETWRATLTIPTTAPVCDQDSGYYKLIWTFSSGTAEQDFQVVAYDEGVQRPPPAGFGVQGIVLVDELYLPAGSTNVECEVYSVQEQAVKIAHDNAYITLDSVTTPTPNSPGSIKATFETSLVTNPIAVGEYVMHWKYTIGGAPAHEYRQGFVVSVKTSAQISSLRMYLDQSQVMRWLGHMQFTDVELIDCLYRGIDRVNIHPPQQSSFTPDNLPRELEHALRVAALHEMLNRLYLAEGMSTFDFQGASIQVTTDRTQYIQVKMDELNTWIDTHLSNIKNAFLSRGRVGVLHISVSQGGYNNNYRLNNAYVRPSAFQLARSNMAGFFI
jgi:hypothetical protein